MRARLFLASVTAALLGAACAHAQPARLVLRVDNAKAEIADGRLVITANGAVRSGGWDRPALVVLQASAPEAKTLRVRFVARPPGPDAVVVQQILPIAVKKVARLPNYAAAKVEIVAETNSVTVPLTAR